MYAIYSYRILIVPVVILGTHWNHGSHATNISKIAWNLWGRCWLLHTSQTIRRQDEWNFEGKRFRKLDVRCRKCRGCIGNSSQRNRQFCFLDYQIRHNMSTIIAKVWRKLRWVMFIETQKEWHKSMIHNLWTILRVRTYYIFTFVFII